jgi:3-hydroxyisobutyrate dehydrogenase
VARIAFIGLGTMGLRMARHLVAAGHELVGFDTVAERAGSTGGGVAASAAEAVRGAGLVLTSLPSPEAVASVVAAVAPEAEAGALFVDLSTGPPRLARDLAASLDERGLGCLDAPVSGGPMGADAASLTIMVGGRAPDFARALPVLQAMGRLVLHVGPHGAGQTAKLCNNLVAGATMAALAEACAIAEAEGIDPGTLYELLSGSTGDSRVLRNRFPLAGAHPDHPSSRDWEPLFALDLIAKDLALAAELGREHGVEPRLAEASLAEYRFAQEQGLGGLDYSAVFLARRARRNTD